MRHEISRILDNVQSLHNRLQRIEDEMDIKSQLKEIMIQWETKKREDDWKQSNVEEQSCKTSILFVMSCQFFFFDR